MTSYRIAISAQNDPVHGWQALVACRSVVVQGERPPLVLVHTAAGVAPGPEFRLIASSGMGEVRPCRDRGDEALRYPPRNIPGALLETAAVGDDLVALVDPDVLMLRRVDFAAMGVGPGDVTVDHVGYLDDQARDPWVGEGCRRHAEAEGVGEGLVARAMNPPYGAICYVVDKADRARLAEAWLRAIEAFRTAPPGTDGLHYHWTCVIWAGMLAIHGLGLRIRSTRLMTDNWNLNPATDAGSFVHFCAGDSTFNKRDYWHGSTAAVWDVKPSDDGTVSDLVRAGVAEAARFYGLDDPELRRRVLVDGDVGASGTKRAPRGVAEAGQGEVPVGDVVGDADGGPGDAEVEVVPADAGLAVGVVERSGREAHVSRLVLPEPRLRRARGRRRSG